MSSIGQFHWSECLLSKGVTNNCIVIDCDASVTHHQLFLSRLVFILIGQVHVRVSHGYRLFLLFCLTMLLLIRLLELILALIVRVILRVNICFYRLLWVDVYRHKTKTFTHL